MKTLFLSATALLLILVTLGSFTASRTAPSDYEETATYYIVIADTSQSYKEVHNTMVRFQQASHAEIDSMGRYYNPIKGKLIVPEDDEDEIYRGEYYPRRFPSTTLSIEYLSMYRPKSSETAFACVVGIFEKPSEAKAYVKKWRSRFPKIYSQKASVYIGCMH
jgi:hypothetical protein